MQQYPQPLERLISELKRLPGVGRVSAERFAFYLLNQEAEQVRRLSQALVQVKERIHPCANCFNYAEEQLCPVCSDPKRDRSLICVVSHPQELLKLERTHDYRGLYHVLGGLLSPINDVHPEDLRIAELLQRLKSEQQFGDVQVKERIHPCANCFNYAEEQLCPVCSDPKRDRSLICVVSHPQELLKLERTHDYRGLYHVLGGLLSPINDVHPEDLRIAELLQRLKSEQVREVILALDPVVEGEATGMYLARAIKPQGIQVSQIAYGVPVGRDLAFADELTLSRALQGRVPI